MSRVGWTRPVSQRGQALQAPLMPLFGACLSITLLCSERAVFLAPSGLGAMILLCSEQGKPLCEVVQLQLSCKNAARVFGGPEDADVAYCPT